MNLYQIIASSGSLMDDENRGMLTLIVTVCGILMVFVALILLIVVISLFGKVLSGAGKTKKKKSAKTAASAASPAAPTAPARSAAPAAKAAPAAAAASSNGIPDEIIAVIAAAVAAMDDGAYVIRSVRRSKEGRPAWSMAGIYENTRPF